MTSPPPAGMFERPAEAYDRFVGRYGAPLARALVVAAGLRPGQRALDVGCGPGALTRELAALLGRERVLAVDPSRTFAEACRARTGVAVEVAAAEALPYADDTVDAALAQLVVNFLDDAPRGVGEMRRVTRPGGTVAAAVWDYAKGMTLLRAFWDAARATDPRAAERDEGTVMRWCSPRELASLWADAGLRDVATAGVEVAANYAGYDDLWEPLELGVGPAGAHVAALDEAGRAALRRELQARLGVGDAPFRLTARAWLVTGRVP